MATVEKTRSRIVNCAPALVILGSFAGLFLACYAPALFQDRQFGYRDAGHYYYPLHQRVDREWKEGRWPLWEPEENAGVPLIGNPTAAVLYPGKVIFALFPYAWAARIYIVAHTALAFGAMLVLLRSWGTSWPGAAIGGFSYAFGAPILFQYCNVIFLVGAAWLPLGVRAVDRFVGQGRRLGLLELAVVLAMMMLGGDPQSAYLLGLAAAGYAVLMARRRGIAPAAGELDRPPPPSAGWTLLGGIAFIILWTATLFLGAWLPGFRELGKPVPPFWWMRYVPIVVAVCWGVAFVVFLIAWQRRRWRTRLGVTVMGLLAAAALAITLSAAQLLPVAEFTQQTARAAGTGPHDIYPFSLEPYRLVEFFWPNVLGTQFTGNTFWLDVVQIPGIHPKIWVPSLYLGGLTFVLAVSVFRLRGGPPRQVWMSAVVAISLLGSLGLYTSPIWITRFANSLMHPAEKQESLASALGPLDTVDAASIRQDGWLKDGDGSFYWWLATLLPGFRQFRYPSKLFTFTTLGLSVLAGLGWDRLRERRMWPASLAAGLASLSVVVLAVVLIKRAAILKAFQHPLGTMFGPFDAAGGYAAIIASLVQASLVMGSVWALILLSRRRPTLAGSLAVALTACDLGWASARFVLTVPQALFEAEPEVLRIIREAESKNPKPQAPYRIHRMPLWNPPGWQEETSPDRVHDFVEWERGTIQPKYAINLGVEYTYTMGVAELYDYEWYFAGFERIVRDPDVAKSLGIEVGKEVVYYPRRAYDMWGTRYFIVPAFPNGWKDEMRGSASFRFDNQQIYPDRALYHGPKGKDNFRNWVETKDYEIHRNLNEYPRAWVVHGARAVRPLEGLNRESRFIAMQEIVYANDPIWRDPTQVAFDPKRLAWVEGNDRDALVKSLSNGITLASETVEVSYPDPQHVILETTLESPGIVVLADVYYPGWKLTVDGKPAVVHRVNRLMRGAPVGKGKHRLEYTYDPMSFRAGLWISGAGLAVLAVLALLWSWRPIQPILAPPAS